MNDQPAQPSLPAAPPPRVSLQDILQMECAERNSSILEIYNDQTLGQVYIENGRIIHATVDTLKGEPALQQLLTLPGGEFELAPFHSPDQRTITTPWQTLLQNIFNPPAADPAQKHAQLSSGHRPAIGESTVHVAEKLLCTPEGEILYASQCPDLHGRKIWLQTVVQQAAQLGEILPLGHFDRMDISFADSRIVMRHRADCLVYVKVTETAT